ncbi:membrane protein of unknown function [Acetoanaerobium sticklandii]|uniref:O-antigen ligase-related domain-containing protein n=1 Tax=Acetoanaerobium sticklandii (strain ATCC 12662 / DSM 519 / JCM 1433 / CCUG 9281 / NCIMB 10654 / HF) TaxID=499177 RepID=E3PV05_ACESD|nr:O-antigen ligase family protein [Acetoanaerobium sticklandii]CBH20485.1 membrane protein of unknown function [Acetoanaerobium sticklandii]
MRKLSNSKDTNIKKDSIKKSKVLSYGHNGDFYYEIYKIIPLLFIVGLLPFVIRLKIIPLEGPFYEFWNGEKINADFFTYYKQIFIYIVTCWAMLNTFLFTKKIKFTKAYYFMGTYAILIILSTVFSKYPQITLNGFVERREGMWIVLCYLLLMFSTINLVETEKQIKAIIYTLGISGVIISIISIFQYFGMDIFATEFAKDYMISKEIQAQIKEFNIQFGEKYSYGVFYNPNYLGGYISFYAPLMLSFAIISKNIKEKIIFSIFFILSILALYGSRSEAGVLGTIGTVLLLILVVIARYIIKDKPQEEYKKIMFAKFVPILGVLIILPVSLSYIPISQNPLTRIRTEAVALFKPSDLKSKDYKEIGPINDIKHIDDKMIEIVINQSSTYIKIDDSSNINILEEDKVVWNKNIDDLIDGEIYILDSHESYQAQLLLNKTEYSDVYGIKYSANPYGVDLYFIFDKGKLNIADSFYKKLDINRDLQPSKHIGFTGKGMIASGRGYIWSRSFPIMIENLLIGTGQDSFVIEFPRNDIYGRQVDDHLTRLWIITDKPHSFYIQVGVQSGVLSLIVILIGIFLLLYRNIQDTFFSDVKYNWNIMSLGIVGYLISSVFNDSILAISPIIYIFIGICISLTIKNSKERIL